jgi:hypothetical protein
MTNPTPWRTKGTDIVAYTFNAEIFHPRCIIAALPMGPGEAFDGWALAGNEKYPAALMSAEENLAEIAAAFGFDRTDERTYDGSEFPKVVFASQVEDAKDTCDGCHEPILND